MTDEADESIIIFTFSIRAGEYRISFCNVAKWDGSLASSNNPYELIVDTIISEQLDVSPHFSQKNTPSGLGRYMKINVLDNDDIKLKYN